MIIRDNYESDDAFNSRVKEVTNNFQSNTFAELVNKFTEDDGTKGAGGDLGFTSCLTYDFEVYSMAQKKWLEVSSVSNFESYQANRLKLRYKDANGNTNLCHTLNGSALALPRIFAAIIENNQILGGINIPKVLHSYTGFYIIK